MEYVPDHVPKQWLLPDPYSDTRPWQWSLLSETLLKYASSCFDNDLPGQPKKPGSYLSFFEKIYCEVSDPCHADRLSGYHIPFLLSLFPGNLRCRKHKD